MKVNKLNIIVMLGLAAIIGILIAQLLWTRQAYTIEEKKFSQKAHIALLETVKKLYQGTTHELPAENPVQKISNDYYIVNVENDFQPEILEFYLSTEFDKVNLDTDFEYAMYNCQSDEMVYGNYVSRSNDQTGVRSVYFPKHKNLVYYFAVRFPNETSFLFSSLKFWFVLSFALVIILLVYVYSIFTIIQQKKYSELQRDFINNMTHEFKTPLSSMLIASSYINKHMEAGTDERLKKYSEIIMNQGIKLNNHIEKILTVAKSDSNAMQLQKEVIELEQSLNVVIENIMLKHSDADIAVETAGQITILADPFHFSNLVYNLLDNSIKYCEGSSQITIKAEQQLRNIELQFTDNGIGVPGKNIAHIFDKFYRISNVKSNATNGFGLGLYYVKKICTLHGWKITATDNEGAGITVTIKIPISP